MKKTLNNMLKESAMAALMGDLFEKYHNIEKRLDEIYLKSMAHKICRRVLQRLRHYLKFSFIYKIADKREAKMAAIVSNSKVIGYAISLFANDGSKTERFIDRMRILSRTRSLSKIGIILVAGISINMILAAALKHEVSLLGWTIRFVFLLLGIIILFCDTDWIIVKRTSYVLRLLRLLNGQNS